MPPDPDCSREIRDIFGGWQPAPFGAKRVNYGLKDQNGALKLLQM